MFVIVDSRQVVRVSRRVADPVFRDDNIRIVVSIFDPLQ